MTTVAISTVLDEVAVGRTVRRLAHEIIEFHNGVDNIVLVGIQTGGAVLAGLLVVEIEKIESTNIPWGTLDITLHRDDLGLEIPPITRSGSNLPDIDGRIVVLIDDVLFTGRSVRAALDAITHLGRPEAVRLAVLVDRGHRELPIRADIVGKNIPTSFGDKIEVAYDQLTGKSVVLLHQEMTINGN
jgi:pyrimidine operon attenuation protein/uracil phosphoribosyltransferase